MRQNKVALFYQKSCERQGEVVKWLGYSFYFEKPMNYYLSVLKKYAVFSGRASRAEYWYFFLFNVVIVCGLGLIELLIGLYPEADTSILITIYQLAILVPSIALGVRRMHDVNKSGWCVLIPIYSLIMMFVDGTKGENKFGPDPKGRDAIEKKCPFCAEDILSDAVKCKHCGEWLNKLSAEKSKINL